MFSFSQIFLKTIIILILLNFGQVQDSPRLGGQGAQGPDVCQNCRFPKIWWFSIWDPMRQIYEHFGRMPTRIHVLTFLVENFMQRSPFRKFRIFWIWVNLTKPNVLLFLYPKVPRSLFFCDNCRFSFLGRFSMRGRCGWFSEKKLLAEWLPDFMFWRVWHIF